MQSFRFDSAKKGATFNIYFSYVLYNIRLIKLQFRKFLLWVIW
jgi:hypothetical protein